MRLRLQVFQTSGRRLHLAAAALLLACATLLAQPTAAQPQNAPESVVEHFQDGLLYTIQNYASMHYDIRVESMEALIAETFDVPRIARTVLGPVAYKSLGDAKRQSYVKLFTRYIVATQAHRLSAKDGQSFSVEGQRDGARRSIIVDGLYSEADGTETRVSYVLTREPEVWRIVDVIVDGAVSEVSLRRSEFAAVVRDEGVDGLLDALNVKIAELRSDALTAGEE